MKKVICVGHSALDRVFTVDAWPQASAKVVASSFVEIGGGMAANAWLWAIAALRWRRRPTGWPWIRSPAPARGLSVAGGSGAVLASGFPSLLKQLSS